MRIRIIDAFTDQPFRGNPAAVCLLDGDTWPDVEWMQRLAVEMNLSETVFALPNVDGADYGIRWFTPVREVTMCGHATLATAHALHVDRGTPATVTFSSLSGILTVQTAADGTLTMDFPASPTTEIPVYNGLGEALGCEITAAYTTGALGDLLTVASDERTVRSLAPDFGAVARIGREHDVRGFIVTAQAAEYDFVSRFFAPNDGIPEDPVTGSAHTALAPFWAERLSRTTLVGLQASARTGVVRTEVRGDRVLLTGTAVVVLDGQLQGSSRPVAAVR
ncbi:PhzF family phenazine biosynthesis protein [Actinocrispum wychmicini]|uniref:PhzF family phenazine biosynthesis protein n=1 Tax=Actinocrispum wychmicini TaxID=1213861 RepID=A0A4R2JPU2_9PSEU|nr:PhzF family phenazine biosynthesis protein [Actinocrispum wychmicini]TCO61017.1 PhzF family phenazine biosynthesis protein [Actinocrispum wychmicini]